MIDPNRSSDGCVEIVSRNVWLWATNAPQGVIHSLIERERSWSSGVENPYFVSSKKAIIDNKLSKATIPSTTTNRVIPKSNVSNSTIRCA